MRTVKVSILSRWTMGVLFECEVDENEQFKMRVAVELAVKQRANLSWANLSDANLSDANLSEANLSEANLSWANLSEANLSWANLSWANLSDANLSEANLSKADLSKADLSEADLSEANLSEANLSEADLSKANLSEANLSKANLSEADLSWANIAKILPDITVPSLHRKILAAIEAGGELEMSSWHKCETTHCRGGWSVNLAGTAGRVLEACLGTSVAAALIHIASCPALEGKVPDFLASNEDALADIRRLAELEPPLETEVVT